MSVRELQKIDNREKTQILEIKKKSHRKTKEEEEECRRWEEETRVLGEGFITVLLFFFLFNLLNRTNRFDSDLTAIRIVVIFPQS